MPRIPRQALRRLGAVRPGREEPARSARHPRRHRQPSPGVAGRACPLPNPLSFGLLARRLGAEFVGTALLLIAVVGSGIAAQRLSPNDIGLELLENSIATGAALAAIILAVGP